MELLPWTSVLLPSLANDYFLSLSIDSKTHNTRDMQIYLFFAPWHFSFIFWLRKYQLYIGKISASIVIRTVSSQGVYLWPGYIKQVSLWNLNLKQSRTRNMIGRIQKWLPRFPTLSIHISLSSYSVKH